MLGSFQRRFGWLFLAGFLLWQLSIAEIIPLPPSLETNYIIAGIQIGFHFPLLAVISRFQEHQAIHRPPPVDPTHLDDHLAAFGISAREFELISLVRRGCSNRDIENQLFISVDTVKKHIFNIYRKLGVKNRVQLSNFIQNRFPGPSGSDGRRAE
jgi:DNA-binding NarL/FixJ family response regulator